LAGASNNVVIVTGTGSLWTNSLTGGNNGLTVGSSGASNRLVVTDGARVDSYNFFVGFSSDNNSALITGNGSLYNAAISNAAALEIGVGGRNNSMVITNGAHVNSIDAYIGNGGSNNTVDVTGSGSQWTN